MKKHIEPFLHIVFWFLVLYITYSNFGVKVRVIKIGNDFEYSTEYNKVFFAAILIYVFFKMILFYGNVNFLLPRLTDLHRRKRTAFYIIVLFVVTLGLSLLINYLIVSTFLDYEIRKGVALISYSVFLHFLFLFLSIGYRLAKDWFKNEIIKNQIIQEKLQTELNFLKAQINPHFMFNTLNNLYAEARKHKDKTVADGIAKLSHIMRYMIYDSNVELVTLDKEIQYLKSYIELQKLRISDKDPFDLKVEMRDVDLSVKVVPILFIPFVENAFKYGLDIEKKCFLHIGIQTTENNLVFKISNSKFNTKSIEEHSGVGLKNVKRRLSLLYPSRHELNIQDNADTYDVTLKLDLN